jgi:hypothetical protein
MAHTVEPISPNTAGELRLPPHANAKAHARIMAKLRTMTKEEFVASLVRSGICTLDGRLFSSQCPAQNRRAGKHNVVSPDI